MRPFRDQHRGHSSVARALLTSLIVCVACGGGGVHGKYTSKDGTVFNFKSNGKVELTTPPLFGVQNPTQELDYAVEDNKIILSVQGQRMLYPLDENGCFVFDAGFVGGKMCKAGSAGAEPEQKVTASNPLKALGDRESRLEGRYTSQDSPFELEFKDGHKVNYTTRSGWSKLDYELNGKEVKLLLESGTIVGTIDDNGCLNFGGNYQPLCKTKITSSNSRNARTPIA